MEDINTVGVIGAGTMGAGIAQTLMHHGIEVRLYDVGESILSRAQERILKGLERIENPKAFSLLRKTTQMEWLEQCDFIIEAVVEELKIKQEVFRRIDHFYSPEKIVASNTSSLSIDKIASATENPDRVVGMHFFNPVPVMRLVEIVRGKRTSDRAVETALELGRRMEKTPVVAKDTPGFIANRVTRPYYLSGMRMIEAGICDPRRIDNALREVGAFRMGPFELMDLIGLDVNLSISKIVYEDLGRPERLKPCAVQDRLVAHGCLGRKNSRGFYLYGDSLPGTVNPLLSEFISSYATKSKAAGEILSTVVGAVVEEARLAAEEGVATPADIDLAMKLGMNWPKGPFEWAKELRSAR